MLNVSIRREEPGDETEIRATNEQAFGAPLEARLVDALRNSPGSISLVAKIDHRVIGHILFTPITTDPPSPVRIAGLGPMSVRPEYQRNGIGAELVRCGLEECRHCGYSAAVLVGHADYYPRFGFVPAHTEGLECRLVPLAVAHALMDGASVMIGVLLPVLRA